MKIRLLDIPEEGFDLEERLPQSSKDRKEGRGDRESPRDWFLLTIREALKEAFPEGAHASLRVHLHKTCRNVAVTGQMEIKTRPLCDRCMEPFAREILVPLKIDIAPADSVQGGEGGRADEDLNFSVYHGEVIHLDDIVREQVLLEIPIRYLCSEECRGLCPHCGVNRNLEACHCAQKRGSRESSLT